MWTIKSRGCYDRSQLRYPNDLTDDEWARVKPLISPAKRGGNRRHVDVREMMNGVMYVLRTGVSGERSRRTCQRAARRCIISTCGVGTAHSIASITISMWILRVTSEHIEVATFGHLFDRIASRIHAG